MFKKKIYWGHILEDNAKECYIGQGNERKGERN